MTFSPKTIVSEKQDAAITIGVFYMLIFQWSWLKSLK